MKKIVIGMSGASGVIYGIRLLEVLQDEGVETHLVVSKGAVKNIELETQYTIERVTGLAKKVHRIDNLAAPISSGSFITEGMVIVPCSMRTLSGVAHSYNENLLIRAADVALKEGRKLILVVRETPLHKGHLKSMYDVADLGGIILPPVPAFYHHPKTIDDVINQTIGKILDLLSIEHSLFGRWAGENG
jgi:flavin prenyltransferase